MSKQPDNIVNVADPGRLIQQSYYAGRMLDRQSDGQHSAWSPWPWNPIQGGGVGQAGQAGAWARVLKFERRGGMLISETIPKLWDMADEDAEARMRQWTAFEPDLTNVIRVRCEFTSLRVKDDPWGPAIPRSQEVPACYFTATLSERSATWVRIDGGQKPEMPESLGIKPNTSESTSLV